MRAAGSDYGLRKPHAFARVPLWVWLAPVAAGYGLLGWHFHQRHEEMVAQHVRDAKVWRIDGPPCPAGSKALFLSRRYHKGPRRFDYENVSFFRRFGHASCAPIYENGGKSSRYHAVCQFSGPGELLIRTRKGEWYFEPGAGQPATISTEHDSARCVMASNFTMASILAEMKGLPPPRGQ